MKAVRRINKQRSLHLVIAVFIMLVLVGIVAFLFWSNFLRSPDIAKNGAWTELPINAAAYDACKKAVDSRYPSKVKDGWVDHRDYSECNPNLIALDELSDQQKDQHKRNVQIMKAATKSHDASKCDQIEGMYYSLYPPNMKKIIPRTEEQAREECSSAVKYVAKSDAQREARLKQYFELPKWGVWLRWSDTSDAIRYYGVDYDSEGMPRTYEFTTRKIETEKQCPLNRNGRLGAISREKDAQKVGKGIFLQTKIGDYYYYDTQPKVLCIAEASPASGSITKARALIRSMIMGVRQEP